MVNRRCLQPGDVLVNGSWRPRAFGLWRLDNGAGLGVKVYASSRPDVDLLLASPLEDQVVVDTAEIARLPALVETYRAGLALVGGDYAGVPFEVYLVITALYVAMAFALKALFAGIDRAYFARRGRA